jgi:hypothetical protein
MTPGDTMYLAIPKGLLLLVKGWFEDQEASRMEWNSRIVYQSGR